jgi:predicted nucleic acid-binding protein
LDGSESLFIDCSVTMAWYFLDEFTPYSAAYLELAVRLGVPLTVRDDALEKAAKSVGVRLFVP